MMDRLREGVNSLAIKIILVIIMLSFVFAGIGSYLVGGNVNAIAKVDGKEITRNQFEQAYQNERNQMQAQYGDSFLNLLGNADYVETLRKSVLEKMINDEVIALQAKKLGLTVPNSEIKTAILSMAEFQKDGQFDTELYQSLLRRSGFTPDSFASYLSRDLLKQQVITSIEATDFVVPTEVNLYKSLFAQRRAVQLLDISPSLFADLVTVSEKEITDHYQQNADTYTRPEQFKVAYIELSDKDLGKSKVTEQEVKQYYKANLNEFSTLERRRISHIQVNDEKTAQAIENELAAGTDFSVLAKKYSQDTGSANNGGDLGWVTRGMFEPAFDSVVFSLKSVGQVSDIIDSRFGYQIVKLEAIEAPKIEHFDAVAGNIKQKLLAQKQQEKFADVRAVLEKNAFDASATLEVAAKASGLAIHHTDFISLDNAPALLKNKDVMAALNSPEVKLDGYNSELISLGQTHLIVVRIDESRAKKLLPLDEVKSSVIAAVKQQKAIDQARELAKQVVAELEQGKSDLLAKHKLTFGEEQVMDRSSALAGAVFALPKPKNGVATFGQTIGDAGHLVIIKLNKLEDKALPTAIDDQIKAQLLVLNQQENLIDMLSVIKKEFDIKYFDLN